MKDKVTKRVFFGEHNRMNGLSKDINNLKDAKATASSAGVQIPPPALSKNSSAYWLSVMNPAEWYITYKIPMQENGL